MARLGIIATVLLVAGPTYATTIRVPADQPTIQAGVNAASDTDTVLVADGTFTGDGNHDIDLCGKAILVKSENGPDYTIIDCGSWHYPKWHGFVFRSGEGDSCVVDGFTVTNDDLGSYVLLNGGGVTVEDAAPAIRNCIFEYGGHEHTVCDNASPSFVNCVFRFNMSGLGIMKSGIGPASMSAGTLYEDYPSLVIKNQSSPSFLNCQFYGSWADCGDGAAVVCTTSSPTFAHCVFKDNYANGSEGGAGGALYLANSQAAFDSCLFDSNTGWRGGAIYACTGSTVTLSGSMLRGNRAAFGIGAAISGNSSSVFLNGCVLEHNSKPEEKNVPGSVIALQGGTGEVSRCTFVGNGWRDDEMPESGVGVAVNAVGAQIVVTNSIFTGNEGVDVIHCDSTATATITCSNIFGNVAEEWVGCIADQYGQNGNISLDPLFCDTTNGNYSPFNFSPCAAANNSCGQLIGAFDVGCSLATMVVLPDEADSGHVLSHMPRIVWSWLPNAVFVQSEYEIEVGSDDDWAVAEMWDPDVVVSAVSELVYQGAALLDGDSYYVRLRTKLNGSWTPWYETSFRMNSLPVKPTLASPHNGTHVGPFVTLYVNNATDPEGDPLAYQFEVYRQPQMVDLVERSDLIAEQADSTGWTVNAYLEENQLYFWRCRAWDGYEYSDWSLVQFFCLDATPEAPPRPALIAPTEENLIVYDMLPTFSWTEVDDPDPLDEVKYRMELAVDKNFTWVASFDGLTQPSYQFADSLLFGTHYWWRVKAFDLGGLFSVSDTADFWSWMLGDVSHNHDCTLGDIMMLVDHLFISEAPISPRKVGDVTGDCDITLGDIMLMVDRLFISGAELLVGCE